LENYHDVFSLSDEERGETDLVEFSIEETGSQKNSICCSPENKQTIGLDAEKRYSAI